MCEPTTLAVLTIASTAMTAYGAVKQGEAQQDINNHNADVARVKARDAIEMGGIAEERHRAQVRQLEGAQRAEMGGSGAVVGTGSFGEMLDQTTKFGELDAQTIRANALKQAWSANTQADADIYAGKSAYQAGLYKAGSTLLSGAAGAYGAGKKAGWFDGDAEPYSMAYASNGRNR